MMNGDPHSILPPGAHNVRDLGGLPLLAGGHTVPRRVLRACAMGGIGDTGRQTLLDAGVRTVIDLRSASELATEPPPFANTRGVTTLLHPVFADLAPVATMIEADADFRLQHRYRLALRSAAPRFAAVVRAVAEAGPGLVVVHCTAGKDRTGIVSALLLDLAGVTRGAIVADYARTADFGAALLATLKDRALAAGRAPLTVEKTLGSPADAMEETLAMLDREFGGARGYLEAAGLDGTTLAAATARLVS